MYFIEISISKKNIVVWDFFTMTCQKMSNHFFGYILHIFWHCLSLIFSNWTKQSIWYIASHSTWHYICFFIYLIFYLPLYQTLILIFHLAFYLAFYPFFWFFSLHSIWHYFWTYFRIPFQIVSDIFSGILSDIYSDILFGNFKWHSVCCFFDILSHVPSDILSDILLFEISPGITSDIFPGILSDILSDILADISPDILFDNKPGILCGIFLPLYLIFYFDIYSDIPPGIPADMISGILSGIFAVISSSIFLIFYLIFDLQIFLIFYLAFFLAFCLIFLLHIISGIFWVFFPAFHLLYGIFSGILPDILCSWLRSGREHWADCGGWGPASNTGHGWSRLRSGGVHWGWMVPVGVPRDDWMRTVFVKVRQGRLGRGLPRSIPRQRFGNQKFNVWVNLQYSIPTETRITNFFATARCLYGIIWGLWPGHFRVGCACILTSCLRLLRFAYCCLKFATHGLLLVAHALLMVCSRLPRFLSNSIHSFLSLYKVFFFWFVCRSAHGWLDKGLLKVCSKFTHGLLTVCSGFAGGAHGLLTFSKFQADFLLRNLCWSHSIGSATIDNLKEYFSAKRIPKKKDSEGWDVLSKPRGPEKLSQNCILQNSFLALRTQKIKILTILMTILVRSVSSRLHRTSQNWPLELQEELHWSTKFTTIETKKIQRWLKIFLNVT